MPDKTNAPRDQRGALQGKHSTAAKSIAPPDFNRCDRSCGQCFVTFIGDRRHCEAEFLAQCRRELAELLAGGGDDA
jgi:hypothetical protein